MSGEDGTQEKSSTEEAKVPNYVEIATEKGWKPFEEYEGNPSGWVDAAEFVKREPLFDKIKNQSKELREMRKTVDAMSTHFQKNVEAGVTKRLQELDEKRDEAIELGDKDAVKAIDKEITAEQQKTVPAPTRQVNPLITEFIETNAWFNANESMREFALAFNKAQLAKDPTNLKGSLDATKLAVEKAFPEYFQKSNHRREAPGTVEGASGGATNSSGGKYTMNRLSDDQKRVYDQMVKRNSILSHDEFFKDLEAIGELA